MVEEDAESKKPEREIGSDEGWAGGVDANPCSTASTRCSPISRAKQLQPMLGCWPRRRPRGWRSGGGVSGVATPTPSAARGGTDRRVVAAVTELLEAPQRARSRGKRQRQNQSQPYRSTRSPQPPIYPSTHPPIHTFTHSPIRMCSPTCRNQTMSQSGAPLQSTCSCSERADAQSPFTPSSPFTAPRDGCTAWVAETPSTMRRGRPCPRSCKTRYWNSRRCCGADGVGRKKHFAGLQPHFELLQCRDKPRFGAYVVHLLVASPEKVTTEVYRPFTRPCAG